MNKFVEYIRSKMRKEPVLHAIEPPGLAEMLINADSQFEYLREQARENIDNAKGSRLGDILIDYQRLGSFEEKYRSKKSAAEAKVTAALAALSNKESRVQGLKIKRSDRGKR